MMLRADQYQELIDESVAYMKRSGPLTYEVWYSGYDFRLEVEWQLGAAPAILSAGDGDMRPDYWSCSTSDGIDALWNWINEGHARFPGFGIIRESDWNLMVAGSSEGSIIVNRHHMVVIDKSGAVTNSVESDGRGKNYVKTFLRWDRRSGRFRPVDAMAKVSYIEDYPYLSKLVALDKFDPVAAIEHVRSAPALD